MTAPGWYAAHGDPPGTQRYWDGAQWVGDAVRASSDPAGQRADRAYDPGYGAFDIVTTASEPPVVASPAPHVGTPAISTVAPGLKTLAVILSVLKAIPLVIGALLLGWAIDQGRDLDRAIGSGNAQTLRNSANTVYVILAIMACLLIVQLLAALTRKPLLLLIIAVVLTLLDVWSTVQQAADGTFVMLVLTLAVTLAQALVAFWSYTVYNSQA